MTAHVTSSAGPGAKFKEPPVQDDEKDAIESLLMGAIKETVMPTQITIQKPQNDQSYRDSDQDVQKRRRLLGFRLDALLCTFAVTAIALVMVSILVALLLLRVPAVEELPVKDDPKSVETHASCGPVRGNAVDGAYSFLGVPYAVPPVGDLRLKKTVPLDKMEDCWQGTYSARRQKLPCYQHSIPGAENVVFSEDCLYLDIYTPDVSFANPLPVVVYFRGESLMGHDKFSISLQPSARLARDTGTVFVSVTFRVHALGFLALNVLRNGHPSTSGNYGLYDMVAALKWIQMNIDSFGGNPRKVTLLGHGSIATAILSLVTSPATKGLYHIVWMSGGSTKFVNASMTAVEQANEEFLREIDCQDRHCLSHKSPQEIINTWENPQILDLPFANENLPAVTVIDKHLIVDLPNKMLNRGQFNDVSMIIGATSYSVGDWGYLDNMNWTEVAEKVRFHLGTLSGELSNDAVAQYLLKDEPVSLQYSKMVADSRIRCPLFQLARRAHARFLNSVFIYSSSHRESSKLRMDIAAIFGQTDQFLGPILAKEDIQYAWRIRDTFYSFIRHHKFGSLGGVAPPGYLDFNGLRVEIHPKQDPKCDLWIKSKIYPQYAKHD